MGMNNKEYNKYVEKMAEKSNIIKDCSISFIVGGIICIIGQIIKDVAMHIGADEKTAGAICSISLIFIVLSSTYKNKSKNVKDENLEKELREFFAKYNMFESSFKENLIELKHLNKKYNPQLFLTLCY